MVIENRLSTRISKFPAADFSTVRGAHHLQELRETERCRRSDNHQPESEAAEMVEYRVTLFCTLSQLDICDNGWIFITNVCIYAHI